MWDKTEYLNIVEKAHREAVGDGNFCYVAVPYNNSIELYRLAICRRTENGYRTLSDDLWLGSSKEMSNEADKLNETRLGLWPSKTARIIGDSMHCKN